MAMAAQVLEQSAIVRARGSSLAKEWRRFDRMLGPIGQRALDALQLRQGERVLDVGCGAGGLSLAAAHRTSKSGCVIGIDVDRQAIEVARARAKEQLLTWTTFASGEPERSALPSSSFDAVVSRFGLSAASDPARALSRIGQTLAVGGRISILVWRGSSDTLWFELPRTIVAACFGAALLPAPRSFAPTDADHLRELCRSVGFGEVAVERVDFHAWAGDDVDDALEFFFETEGRLLDDRLDQKQFERLTAALKGAYAEHDRPDGVCLPASAWLVTARTAA
jgi:ubiquinone/menaquinone biosynthesis C-methylase UbiE